MMSITKTKSLKALAAGALAAAMAVTSLGTVDASSHREAPLISQDPAADNTDTYAFVSPTNPDNTVLVANYIPLQQPSGGPNFYNWGDDVLYEIHVDNTGDGVANHTFEARFTTELANPETTLYANGQITDLDSESWNLRQSYELSLVSEGVRTVLGQDLVVPPNNIGPRTTPNYADLANAAIAELPGDITAFAGQRDDPFWVDLGSIFDLGALRPFEELHVIPEPDTDPIDSVAGKNTHSLVIEVPSATITSDDSPVVGVWATASRRQTRVFAGGNSATPVTSGPFRQVSRLGMPLVNEIVIPTGLKDAFNTLSPNQDAAVLAGLENGSSTEGAVPIVTDPELADLLPVLYPGAFGEDGAFPLPATPRNDLLAVFLTGVGTTTGGLDGLCLTPGVDDCAPFNAFVGDDVIPAEYIRLNTAVPPADGDLNNDERMGALGGDAQGFPNGRRLADDVVDIELQVVAGALVQAEFAPLTDGTLTNDVDFLNEFPYVAHPHDGYSSTE